jgi:catechol 2,3-dioxygenase-like lactoylglutathione lyase family enzyme
VELSIRRVIIFTRQMEAMTKFYRDVIGLAQINEEPGWKEFAAGGCNLALHAGTSAIGSRPPKLVFYSRNVAETRGSLLRRGATLGKVKSASGLHLCEGRDPDGNPFQISNRS